MATVLLKRWARLASDYWETRRWRRALGRRYLLARLELIPPSDSPDPRWRDVYADFAKRQNLERTLRDIWLIGTPRRAFGGLILSEIPQGLLLHTTRVPRPWRGLGIADRLIAKVIESLGPDSPPVWLQVLPDNTPAVRLYRHHGFQDVEPPDGLRREGHILMKRSV